MGFTNEEVVQAALKVSRFCSYHFKHEGCDCPFWDDNGGGCMLYCTLWPFAWGLEEWFRNKGIKEAVE